MMRFGRGVLLAALLFAGPAFAQPHNLVLFVADALRSQIVDETTAPDLQAVRHDGVDFRNSHSLFPTVTTANASVIATGHRLGDTGNFGNTLYVGEGFADGALLAALENDATLGHMNARFEGNYLSEDSLLAAARAQGFQTAVLGKLGPAAIQDVTARDGAATLVFDDSTGRPGGFPLPADVVAAIKAAGLPDRPPGREENARQGDWKTPGTLISNKAQQDWFVAVAREVLLPRFKATGKPFVIVFWSRDPDGTQHNQGDSLNQLVPGVNGPTSLGAIRNASEDLGALRRALADQGLADATNVVVTADHGVSVTSKASKTSYAATLAYPDVAPGQLPPGFPAIDLAKALDLPLFDARGAMLKPEAGQHPKGGALLGREPKAPTIVLAPNGGAEHIYLPGPDARALAQRIVAHLTTQDYVGALFVRDDLGPIPGALPLSKVGLTGAARTPTPAITISFRSFSTGCDRPEVCGAEVADTDLSQGQGIHGTLSRQDTHNFMAAIGPDFKAGFVDPAPVSNADLAITLAKVLEIDLKAKGKATGRVLGEALVADGKPRKVKARSITSKPADNGFTTRLDYQAVGKTPYFDAAGAPDRTIGMEP